MELRERKNRYRTRAQTNDPDRDHFPDGAVDPGNLSRLDAGAVSRRNDSQLAISRDSSYFQGLTLHGVVNAIVFTTFFAVAFGYAIIRYYLRRPLNMKVAWLSFALMVVGTLLAAAAILSGKATVLYTFYPPLRAHPGFLHWRSPAGRLARGSRSSTGCHLTLPGNASIQGEKVPLAVVGIFATFIIWLIATTPVAIEVIFLLIPWSMGWVATVNVPLARMLFWFFGHPLVYFWLVPAYVMYYTMLPKLAGGKLFSDFAGRLTFLWLVLYSAPVGIHHQFTEPGISSTWKFVHAFFTMLVAVPSFRHRLHHRRVA